MKCLSRIEMQEYIDGEVNSTFEKEILIHLEGCDNCTSVYKEAVSDKGFLNKLLTVADSGNELQLIPDFKYMGKKRQSFIRIAVIVAAASMIGVLFLFRLDKVQVSAKIPEAELLMYEFYNGTDLNKMWHEQSQILIIQDEKGKVIKSIITY